MHKRQNLHRLLIYLTILVPYYLIKFKDSSKFYNIFLPRISIIFTYSPSNIHKEEDHILYLFYNTHTLQECKHHINISSYFCHICIHNTFRNQPNYIDRWHHIFDVCKVIVEVNNYLTYFLLFISQKSFILVIFVLLIIDNCIFYL